MALIQCDKCSEMVDEAKAFCPACGNSLVEEERRSISTNFEEMANTVQLGETMYNQMLSDMGLNISRSPKPEEHRVGATPLKPATEDRPAAASTPAKSGALKWVLIGAAVAILLVLLVIVVAAAIIYWLRPVGA